MFKLNIKDGIILDKEINGIPIVTRIISTKGKNNVRTGIKLRALNGFTVHDTANNSPSADAENHAKYFSNVEINDTNYVGAHLFIDHDSIVQILPLDEVAYHATDGKGDGNYTTVALELCENGYRDIVEHNAKMLLVALLLTYGKEKKLYTHNNWYNAKKCPRVILGRVNGWRDFTTSVANMAKEAEINTGYPVSLSNYAKEGYDFVVKNGISDGSNPTLPLTREQAWVMLDRMYKLLSK